MKVSESQKKASRKWEKKNPEEARIGSYRRSARLFIKSYASEEDLVELEELISNRRAEVSKG